jgi:hypothetical protein
MLSTRFMQVTLQSSQLLGVQYGIPSMTISYFLSPQRHCPRLFLTSGSLTLNPGICNFCLTLCPSHHHCTTCHGCLPKMVYALLKTFTCTCHRTTWSNFPTKVLEAFFPQANQILQRAWKRKDVPPLIKAFTWRLIKKSTRHCGSGSQVFHSHR